MEVARRVRGGNGGDWEELIDLIGGRCTVALNRLEDEFDGGLHQARAGGADYLAEGGTADVAIDGCGAEELRVVEGVECFGAELEGAVVFCEKAAGDGGVEILHAGAGEEAATRVAHGSQPGQREL